MEFKKEVQFYLTNEEQKCLEKAKDILNDIFDLAEEEDRDTITSKEYDSSVSIHNDSIFDVLEMLIRGSNFFIEE